MRDADASAALPRPRRPARPAPRRVARPRPMPAAAPAATTRAGAGESGRRRWIQSPARSCRSRRSAAAFDLAARPKFANSPIRQFADPGSLP
ncbi:MAG: hypothetical protein DLM58_18670 [Pseudonocardiales bacterium]|nr:MAG: hypothetical protein DLM58_18670 [Pseudonocardiales bacterium]